MITKKEILKIAALSKIKFSENEIESLFKNINNILDYVKKIHNYNISKKDKNNHAHDVDLRQDEVCESGGEFLVSQFSEKKDNLLRVRKVF